MISVDRALEKLVDAAQPVCGVEVVPLARALSRVLAGPITSPLNVPPADNSSMDGYAVRAGDIEIDKPCKISQRVTSGQVPNPHIAGTATRIFTGAEIPAGADAVIVQEHTEVAGSKVVFKTAPKEGDNIREKGQDVLLNSEILAAGRRLRAQEVGLIASCGIQQVSVYKRLRLALVSTGDELVDPGTDTKPGQIYNSNKYLITGLCQQAGMELVDMGTVKDNLEATKTRLMSAADEADLVLTTGGVSAGEEDHIRAAVQETGQINLWKVAIKPGKPLAFGKVGNTDFIGLPGNPSSVFTSFLILALPRLKLLQGWRPERPPATEKLRALFARGPASRREYLRGRRSGEAVEIFPNQSSGVLSSACWGDGLVIHQEHREIKPGQQVEFIPYLSLF